MTPRAEPRAGSGYARFLATAAMVAVAVGAAGYLPTLYLSGAAAVPALVVGCLVAVAASAVGGVPIALSGPDAASRPQAALLAMAARLLTVLTLGLAAAATGRFATRPLAIWTAISYLAQLVVDSRYAMRAAAGPQRRPAAGSRPMTRDSGGPGDR
ncbi:MAG TPA: hypothetical protein VHG32_02015 [Thermoanaerobaculia bacterium]|nr:hypothetical protein [Thermoanaerobaculia bacterium]